MEEQPHESPAEQPADTSDERPKIFKNINGWIAGVTGAVIALGGLATAVKQFMPDKKPATEQVANTATPAKIPAPAAAADTSAEEPDQGDPLVYEGDGVKLEWTDEEWLLTGKDGTYHYEDMYSPDDSKVLGYDKANNAYLRWPIKGGMSEEGSADKQTWTNYIEIFPPEG
jgi:hypothetical protein